MNSASNSVLIEKLNEYKKYDEEYVNRNLNENLQYLREVKIVVLDDDPTGIQTVHDIPVYTDWKEKTMEQAFLADDHMFFILTNSRGLTEKQSESLHKDAMNAICDAAAKTEKNFIIVSRSDSTLRGHFPMETEVIRQVLETRGYGKLDGEIICPFFKDGGRYTIDNIHYVQEGNILTPAGMTEFAKDKTFGYHESDLCAWCEEKSQGKYKAGDVTAITLEDLRSCNYEKITSQLCEVHDFNKVIVNSIDEMDIKVFITAFVDAVKMGKKFIFRSAAVIPKILGGVKDKELLTVEELRQGAGNGGGIVLIGSHVYKTTKQMEYLQNSDLPLHFIQFNQHLVLEDDRFQKEIDRVVKETDELIEQGKSVVVYTRRERFDLSDGDKDAQLMISVKISDAITGLIGKLRKRPSFIVAKGGITSSDVGTKSLQVRKAMVMGQICPGVPVWKLGEESKFPGMPYVIFPGNVGSEETLTDAVRKLMS